MPRLERRRVVVTGAGSGIGAAIVRRFLEEGAKVVAVDRRPFDNLTRSDSVRSVIGDVTDYAVSARAVTVAEEAFGGLDVFIANAGVWDFYKRLDAMTPEALARGFDDIFAVNVRAALFAAHAARPALRASKGALIVTGSNAGSRAGGGGALYTASKFALRGAVAALARELAPDVRVNGVAPGATDTPLSGSAAFGHEARAFNTDRDRIERLQEAIPIGRFSSPEDHVGLYMLLASVEAPYVTGAMLPSDGGLTA